MTEHTFVADPAISIVRGLPLAEDAGLGELALAGFIRQGTERGQRATPCPDGARVLAVRCNPLAVHADAGRSESCRGSLKGQPLNFARKSRDMT